MTCIAVRALQLSINIFSDDKNNHRVIVVNMQRTSCVVDFNYFHRFFFNVHLQKKCNNYNIHVWFMQPTLIENPAEKQSSTSFDGHYVRMGKHPLKKTRKILISPTDSNPWDMVPMMMWEIPQTSGRSTLISSSSNCHRKRSVCLSVI